MNASISNENLPREFIFTRMRDKFKAEIRKNRISDIFKLKRLAFQENFQISEETPAFSLENANSLSKEHEYLSEILEKLSNPAITEQQLLENLIFIRVHSCEFPKNKESTIFMLKNGLFELLNDFVKDFEKFNVATGEEILWILCNVTYMESKETDFYNKANFVPFLISCINSEYLKIQELAAWSLCNLADDSLDLCKEILQKGALDVFRFKCTMSKVRIEIFTSFLTILHAFSNKKEAFFMKEIIKNLDVILMSLKTNEESIYTHSLILLGKISNINDRENIEILMQSLNEEYISLIFQLFHLTQNEMARIGALLVVCNLLAEDDDSVQKFIEIGLLDFLQGILDDEKIGNSLKKYALFAISNCLACDNAIITPILNHNIFEIPLWTKLSSDYEINKEIAYCIINILSKGTNEQIIKIVKKGFLECFVEVSNICETNLVLLMLDGIKTALSLGLDIEIESNDNKIIMDLICKGTIPNWLVSLQNHASTKVYEKSYKLLETFFNCEQN